VAAVARGAIAAGADGLIVEVHTHPEGALSDGPQQLRPAELAALLADLRALAPIVRRTL
jgi:3-deoxy-7-phosphoheptulonate synthase